MLKCCTTIKTRLTAIVSYCNKLTFPVACEWTLKSVRSSSSEAAPGLSILFPSIRIGAPDTCSSANKPWGWNRRTIIGVSLSKPHTGQLKGIYLYACIPTIFVVLNFMWFI